MALVGKPTAQALTFEFTYEGKDYMGYVDAVQYNDFFVLDCRYKLKSDNEYTFLRAIEIDTTTPSRKPIDVEIREAVEGINARLKEVFPQGNVSIPVGGIERLRWVIKNALSFDPQNIQLVLGDY